MTYGELVAPPEARDNIMPFKTIFQLFPEAASIGIPRATTATVILLQLASTFLELLGVVSIVPVYQYLEARGSLEALASQGAHWRWLGEMSEWSGVPITLGSLLLISLCFLMMRQILVLSRTILEYHMQAYGVGRLRAEVFESFLRAKAEYQDRVKRGDMVSAFAFDTTAAISHITGRMGIATQLVICGIYLGGMISMSPYMTALMLVVIALSGIVIVPGVLAARRLGRARMQSDRDAAEFITERFQSTRLIRLSDTEPVESRQVRKLTERQAAVVSRGWKLFAVTDAFIETSAILISFLGIYLCVSLLNVELALIGVFLIMLMRLLPVVRQIARTKQSVDSTRPAFDKIVAAIRAADENRELSGGERCFDRLRQGIEFDRVEFRYAANSDLPVLDGVSLSIPARTAVAIVGPSGAGKSTLVDLIQGMRARDSGSILFDGMPQEEFSVGSLRRGIAYAPQEPQLFDVTVEEHIRYGKADATDQEIREAARLAQAREFIDALPQGFASQIGPNGSRLSGGQRRRLDLARALVRKAPILIIDEPTANLDAESERLFHEAMKQVRSETDTTIIMISHNLLALSDVDQIVVLVAGRVEAAGTHESLLRRGGWYAGAYASQSGGGRQDTLQAVGEASSFDRVSGQRSSARRQ